eukprot:gene3935-2800_t
METKQKKNADTYLVRRTWGALISQAVVTSLRCPSHKGQPQPTEMLFACSSAVACAYDARASSSARRCCRGSGCWAPFPPLQAATRGAVPPESVGYAALPARRVHRLVDGHWHPARRPVVLATRCDDEIPQTDSTAEGALGAAVQPDAGGRRRYKENACTTREEDKKNGKKRYRKTKITLCGMEILSDRLTYVRRFALLPLLEPLLYFVRSFMRACLCVTLQQSSGEGLSWGSSSLPILLPSRIRASTPRLVASMVLIVVGPSFGSQLAAADTLSLHSTVANVFCEEKVIWKRNKKKNADTYLVRRTWGALISQAVVTSLRCPSHKGSHNLPRCWSGCWAPFPPLQAATRGAVPPESVGYAALPARRVHRLVDGHWHPAHRPVVLATRCDDEIPQTDSTAEGRWGRLYSLLRRLTAAHQVKGFHDSFGKRSKAVHFLMPSPQDGKGSFLFSCILQVMVYRSEATGCNRMKEVSDMGYAALFLAVPLLLLGCVDVNVICVWLAVVPGEECDLL